MGNILDIIGELSERVRHLETVEADQIGDGAPTHFAAESVTYWDRTNDGFYVNNDGLNGWTLVGGGGAGVTPHAILSTAHSDAAVDAVTRGSIIYGNSTPEWDELVVGGAGTYLRSDGTDASWQVIHLADIPQHNLLSTTHGDTVTSAVTRGSIIYGDATPDWNELAIGGAGTFLRSDGNDPSWQVIQLADVPQHNLLSTTHGDTSVNAVTRGSLVYGDATPDWNELVIGGAGTFLRSDGTDPSWQALVVGDIPAHDLLSATHGDTVASVVTRGDLVVGTAAGWDDLAHPGGAGYALTTDANDVTWDQTPNWSGRHVFEAGADLDDGVGDSPTLRFIGGTNDDTALVFLDEDATATDSDLVVRLCDAAGDSQFIIQDSSPATVAYIDSDGLGYMARLGLSIAVTSSYGLYHSETRTSTAAGGEWGLRSLVWYNPGAGSATQPRGVEGALRVTAANAQNFTGTWYALRGAIEHDGTGTMSDVRLCDTSFARGSTGTVTDLYGYFMAAFPAAGVTNGYGLYLGNVTGTNSAYAIYTNSGECRFGGMVNGSASGVRSITATDNVSDPPTDLELDTAFGTPATVGEGFIGFVDDNNAETTVWLCVAIGSTWWYTELTKAV